MLCERVRAPSCDEPAEQQHGDDGGAGEDRPERAGDDVDEAAAADRSGRSRPGRRRPRPPPPRPRRSPRRPPAARRRARPPAITSTAIRPGRMNASPPTSAPADPPRAARCRSPAACSPARAAGCRRRTRPRTRGRRSRPLRCDRQIAQQRDVRGRPAEAEHADPAPLPRHGGKGRGGHAPYLAQWDGSSTCPTSRRRARRAAGRRPAARRADAPAHARGVRRPDAPARAVVGAADRDPVRRAALDDPLRAAGDRQDDAGADARRVRRRGLRGALGRRGGPRARCAR